jgi:hypothetical protein
MIPETSKGGRFRDLHVATPLAELRERVEREAIHIA